MPSTDSFNTTHVVDPIGHQSSNSPFGSSLVRVVPVAFDAFAIVQALQRTGRTEQYSLPVLFTTGFFVSAERVQTQTRDPITTLR